jgi:hypothetical protein
LKENRPLLERLLSQLFWIVHFSLHRPSEAQTLQSLLTAVGRQWGAFLFPLETDTRVDPGVRDLFVDCIPYFMTQCIQHIFVLISKGLPETTTRDFRMLVCATLVKLFTMIDPLESLLQSKLGSYFSRPPQVDIVAAQPAAQSVHARTLLPVEDLHSLIEIPRRERPRSSIWTISAISTLVSASTHRRMVPFEHNASIVVQYPKDGESDWTTELPPLLPAEHVEAGQLTFEGYEPAKDSRSLLYRSRRPALCDDYVRMKREFETENGQARRRLRKGEAVFGEMKERAKKSPILVLKRFCEDIRVLQLERKWSESPEWHTEQELIDLEEQRLTRERMLQKEAEEALELRKARRQPRLLPFEIEERRRQVSEPVPMDEAHSSRQRLSSQRSPPASDF